MKQPTGDLVGQRRLTSWRPFQSFFRLEAASGVVLIVFAVAALIWANTPWAESYFGLKSTPMGIAIGDYSLTKSVTLWINDGLMAVFFFMVGLEIKREFIGGELSSIRTASLALAGALGGIVVPAAIYVAFNAGGPGQAGWAVPMATDIAFALGVLALVGSRAPLALKVFLSALAIIDDLVAVLVIAVFYTAQLNVMALTIALALFGLLLFIAKGGRPNLGLVVVLGIALWFAVLKSGVHATVAGVLTALAVPHHRGEPHVEGDRDPSLLETVEHAIQPWVAFGILPLFALANAGVVMPSNPAVATTEPIALGAFLGLTLGKPIGIFGFVWVAVRLGIASRPADVSWRHLHGCAWLCGIGFTMSLFIAGLAFTDPASLDLAKVAVLAGSVAAGTVGWLILRGAPEGRNAHASSNA